MACYVVYWELVNEALLGYHQHINWQTQERTCIPWRTSVYKVPHLSGIPSCAGAESLKNAWPSRGCGASTAVRYGLRILHCYLPPDLGHSAGLRIQVKHKCASPPVNIICHPGRQTTKAYSQRNEWWTNAWTLKRFQRTSANRNLLRPYKISIWAG